MDGSGGPPLTTSYRQASFSFQKKRLKFSIASVAMATLAIENFNRFFWNEKDACLYDVVNGGPPDPSIRPNQIFAVSLSHSMLPPERAKSVVANVQEHLLTPYGLRSLAPSDPQYRGRYTG